MADRAAATSCCSRRRGRARYNAAALRARIAEEPFKSALANAWRAVDINGVLAHFLATDALARAMAAAPRVEINTDDRNVVEFGLARSVGRPAPDPGRGASRAGARRSARRVRRSTRDAGIDWPAVDTAWANVVGWGIRRSRPRPAGRRGGARQDGAAALLPGERSGRRAGDLARAGRAGRAIRRSWRWRRTSKPKRDRTRRCR